MQIEIISGFVLQILFFSFVIKLIAMAQFVDEPVLAEKKNDREMRNVVIDDWNGNEKLMRNSLRQSFWLF